MQTAYNAQNLIDAHLVKHALEAAGIPVYISGESLLGGGGELPLFGVLRVCVPEAALAQAQQIITALDLGGASDEDAPDEDGPGGSDILPA
ncbi:putative signal transducing protein [Pseudoxanthomonas dokdonensis]|uniref:DUF2007 domain-containing protein n=1 Tax=Pseudoxanthomonas dokdonensis TaxID=344882 RepID=A0A0R0CNN1_9GAMM|nr:DUF2007 domain-containing protein [Pseudoxanthomonas dokdonensis]KRG71253.1 hypothetical protein ABB29_03050 [Pseudoxanthomonas dokdonensis]